MTTRGDTRGVGLKAVSAWCFFASYCTTHPLTQGLLLVGLASPWAVFGREEKTDQPER